MRASSPLHVEELAVDTLWPTVDDNPAVVLEHPDCALDRLPQHRYEARLCLAVFRHAINRSRRIVPLQSPDWRRGNAPPELPGKCSQPFLLRNRPQMKAADCSARSLSAKPRIFLVSATARACHIAGGARLGRERLHSPRTQHEHLQCLKRSCVHDLRPNLQSLTARDS